MKRLTTGIAVILFLSACEEKARTAPARPDPFAVARLAVRQLLKDPNSASFRQEKRGSGPGSVCGEVNAKNEYGGFVGYIPYIYDAKAKQAAISPGSPNFGAFIDNAQSGLQITSPVIADQMRSLSQACSFERLWVDLCVSTPERPKWAGRRQLCLTIEKMTKKIDALPR